MTKQLARNSFLEIDLSILKNNLTVLSEFLAPGVEQMAVVKADAYGHGAVEVAVAIQEKVAWFAVNDVDEGVALREAGIQLPILVFGVPTDETAPAYPNYELTATVSALSHFSLLRPGTEYHLNFDTGMGRLGLYRDEIAKAKSAIQKNSESKCTGIYSHFATADDPDSEKAAEQLKLFNTIRKEFDSQLLTHMANTGGTAFYPASHFDMVRNGIGIYGYAPGVIPLNGLEPSLRWESHLVQVKRIKKGGTVSYGARWRAPEDGYIGTIPVGYEEGIPRILTGNLEVAIGQEIRPVVGTVTMNYIMVYLGGKPKYESGTPVEILGQKALDAERWAQRTGTIPYEILTGISCRIPKRYRD